MQVHEPKEIAFSVSHAFCSLLALEKFPHPLRLVRGICRFGARIHFLAFSLLFEYYAIFLLGAEMAPSESKSKFRLQLSAS